MRTPPEQPELRLMKDWHWALAIRKVREAQGLSPEDLAERVEVPVERILALEAGDSRAQAELLTQAIRPLGLDEVSIELSRVMAADPHPEAPPRLKYARLPHTHRERQA